MSRGETRHWSVLVTNVLSSEVISFLNKYDSSNGICWKGLAEPFHLRVSLSLMYLNLCLHTSHGPEGPHELLPTMKTILWTKIQ